MHTPTPSRAPTSVSPRQRQHLRGLAHGLKPVVQIGGSGITDAVVAAVDAAFETHELLKVRMREPQDKTAMANEIANRTKATLCGLVGHTAILYRRHPKDPRITF